MLYLVILWKKTYPLFWTYKIMSSNLMCLSHSTESGRVPLYRWKKAQVLRRYEVACKTPRIQQTCRVMWADWRHTMEETHEHQGCYLAETSMSLYWLVGGCIHSTIIKGDDPVYQIFFINSKQSGEPTPCQAKVQICTTSLSNPLIPNLLVSTGFQQKLDGDGVKGVQLCTIFWGANLDFNNTVHVFRCGDIHGFMSLQGHQMSQ